MTNEELEVIKAQLAEKIKEVEAEGKAERAEVAELIGQIKEMQAAIEAERGDLKSKAAEYDDALQELKKVTDKKEVTSEDDRTDGFKGLSEFLKSVYDYGKFPMKPDPRLVNIMDKAAGSTGMQEGVGAEGGFLIPLEYREGLLQEAIEKSNFIQRCTEIPMQYSSVSIPFVKDTDHSGGEVAGMKAYWVQEEGEYTPKRPSMGRIQLNLHKLAGLAYVTEELLRDSPVSIEPLLRESFTDVFSWTIDNAILNGTGVGQPMGILNAEALQSVPKETNQTAATICFENIVKMYAHMPERNRQNAIWIANNDCIPQLFSLNFSSGTAGIPVFIPPTGVSGSPYSTLYSRPIIFSEHCQTVGTVGDIYFADLSQYLVGVEAGAGLRMSTSIHVKFEYDQMAFKFTYRVDGRSKWPSKMTPRYATTFYMSPFVALASRE